VPPSLPHEYANAAGHEAYGRQYIADARQQSGGFISEKIGECPRAVRPNHPGLQLKQSLALSGVQQMNQAMQHDEYTNDEPQ
jgi:hypothetical protein